MCGYVANSLRTGLKAARHTASVAAKEEGCTHRVVRVLKNSMRQTQSRYDGVSRFSKTDAEAYKAMMERNNPNGRFEIEAL